MSTAILAKPAMSDGEREHVRQLTERLKEIFVETGGAFKAPSDWMAPAQVAELLSINDELSRIFGKYSGAPFGERSQSAKAK